MHSISIFHSSFTFRVAVIVSYKTKIHLSRLYCLAQDLISPGFLLLVDAAIMAEGKNNDKANAIRSKHSVTEQRRRSKINER